MHLRKIEITTDEKITTNKVAIANPKALTADEVTASNGHNPKSWHNPGLFDHNPLKKIVNRPSFVFFIAEELTPSTVFKSFLLIIL